MSGITTYPPLEERLAANKQLLASTPKAQESDYEAKPASQVKVLSNDLGLGGVSGMLASRSQHASAAQRSLQ